MRKVSLWFFGLWYLSEIGISLLFAAAPQAEFYVSPTGSDANPGTKTKPFLTLSRAQDAVQTVNQSMTGDIVVYLREGLYPLEAPLIFTGRDSGTKGFSILYQAYPNEKPILSGGKRITGWRKIRENRWSVQTDINEIRQLYVNGKRANRTRGVCPAGVERYGSLEYYDGNAGFIFPEGSLADWKNPADMELGFFQVWSHMICKVAGITRNASNRAVVRMIQPEFMLACRKEGVRAEIPNYIENAYELLDEPGEWYWDRSRRTIEYIPRDSEDMAAAQVVVPILENLIRLEGTLDQPVRNIHFAGMVFSDATWLQPNRTGHIDLQANFTVIPIHLFERSGFLTNVHNECRKSPANVVLHAAVGCSFERCEFTRLGGAGIDMEAGSQDNQIRGCCFHDISGSAVQIGDVLLSDHHPEDSRLIVKNNEISNNYIHDIGVEYRGSVGVFVGYTDGTRILHNEICDLPYSGISAGWGWGEADAGGSSNYPIPYKFENPTPSANNRIENNHIHHVMSQLTDGGGIYTLGNMPGTVIRGNHIHDNQPGSPGGIYLDEGSGFIEITKNYVYNVQKSMNYNNLVQDRKSTCKEHDNFFELQPESHRVVKQIVDQAGLESAFRDLPGLK